MTSRLVFQRNVFWRGFEIPAFETMLWRTWGIHFAGQDFTFNTPVGLSSYNFIDGYVTSSRTP